MVGVLQATGKFTLDTLSLIGRLAAFAIKVFTNAISHRPFVSEVIAQSHRIGVQTAGILSTILFVIGANVALVGYATFQQFGGQNLIGIYVGLSCVIGLAPIIVGAMLGAKPGTEIAAAIASMRVNQQIDALEVMAVDPIWYLMVPRFVAYLIVTPALLALAFAASIAGGYMAAVFQCGVNPGTFINDVVRFLSVADLMKGMIRAEIFSLLVCLLACFYGFNSAPGPAGVSRAINLAVVVGSTAIIVLNYFLTELMY
jgi:phospholipid/cholesterol/gamma-HCH transport system permease protein